MYIYERTDSASLFLTFSHTTVALCLFEAALSEWYMWQSTQRCTAPDFPLQSAAAQSVQINLTLSVPQLLLVPMTTSMCSDTHNLSTFPMVMLQYSIVNRVFPCSKDSLCHSVRRLLSSYASPHCPSLPRMCFSYRNQMGHTLLQSTPHGQPVYAISDDRGGPRAP